MAHPIYSPRKLIEVALPLDAINEACAYEKMPGIGAHPRGIHLWWARRPLAAARAVIFAQMVNDPGYQQGGGFKYGKNKKEAAEERKRLFGIIEDLVKWENSTNKEVLERARAEIRRSWREVCELNKDHPQAAELFNPDKLPAFHDPFAGGGALPLEAQRLGLESYATDLNPVPVLINKAMIEIPPKFAGRPPVGPFPKSDTKGRLDIPSKWPGAMGLAEDVRRYGAWMREEAIKRIGKLYPPVKITAEMAMNRPELKGMVGKELPVITWLWARTVKSPNPAFSHVDVPLASSFVLSSKAGRETYVQPVINGDKYTFTVKSGVTPEHLVPGTTAGKRKAFRCLMSDTPIDYNYIREEGKAGRMGQKLMAIVAEVHRGKIYLEPNAEVERIAIEADPSWKPDMTLPHNPRDFKTPNYGLTTYGDLFTPRQLAGINTFCDLVREVRQKIRDDAIEAGWADNGKGLDSGGIGATAYSEAVSVYLAFAVTRLADFGCSIATWKPSGEQVMQTFKRQAIPMTWDFPESNFLGEKAICLSNAVKYVIEGIEMCYSGSVAIPGNASQADAQTQSVSKNKVISTDPPYYDNIGYADLSDFFYIWLRRSLRDVFPSVLATVAVPKAEELVATPYRHGTKDKAEAFFLDGMTQAIHNLAVLAHPEGPVTIYYAFKQAETNDDDGTSSTGWETFLSAVVQAGFSIVGTWPLRSEQEFRMIGMGNNALASSIVLVCRKRSEDSQTISRRDFLRELNQVLPEAMDEMTRGAGAERSPVAPVDLSQAIIGPGMAVFSKYAQVLEADGNPMSVKSALQIINRFLAEDDFDMDTQFCLRWFEQNGWESGVYGEADNLARAKAISVSGLAESGVVHSGGGKVRLRKWAEYPAEWNPEQDKRVPVWEVLHQLIRALKNEGETESGRILAAVKEKAESSRQLAYRLYTLCERQGWADDARAYNEIITSWTGVETAASAAETNRGPTQGKLFE
jgi:putative DNA methylase